MFKGNYPSILWSTIAPNGAYCLYVNVNLCQTQRVLARSPEPEAHDEVLDNNPDRIGGRLQEVSNKVISTVNPPVSDHPKCKAKVVDYNSA